MRGRNGLMASIIMIAMLAACSRPAETKKWDSIQAAMAQGVDPAADALWAAVGTVETAAGSKTAAPRNDADWHALAIHADTLAGAADFLDGLPPAVGSSAAAIADAHVEGTRTAVQIDADVKADPDKFRASVAPFRQAALAIRSAIAKRDQKGFFEAGEQLDAACDNCHFRYWHPRVTPAHLPSAEEFEHYRP